MPKNLHLQIVALTHYLYRKATVFIFSIFTLCVCQFASAQAPKGYTLCASENGTFTLPAKSHIAYGADNKYKYLFNQTGIVTFDNETFGGDPIFGTFKSGYYKLANGTETPAVLQSVIAKLKNHLTGFAIMTPQAINLAAEVIQQNIFVIADNDSILIDAFDLVDCYEKIIGPIFINNATKGGFPNEFGANDGYEFVRAVFLIQQGIMDYIYHPDNVKKYLPHLKGRKFLTASHFPGACPEAFDSLKSYTTKINASMPKEYGKRTAFSSTSARRPTGYYLASGSIGKVKVPISFIDKGFKILVGAHTFERTGNNPCRRFFRVTNTFPIIDTITEIANPFGGGIYIITPYEANEGIVDITLTNVVPAPFFSAKSFDYTSLQKWQDTIRKYPAPWADFESDKYMMQVPTNWIYNYVDPATLMADWDNRMDVVSKLLGYPALRNNTILYLQIDVDIMFGGYGIGNPQINNTYNPADVENGNKEHWFLKPGVEFWETEFHEMGHAQLFSIFPGETEAAVNVPAAAIYNRLYNVNIDTALGESFGNQPQITRDQAAMNWMVTPNFRAGKPMDISNTTKDEVRYQQRGYAKYIEIAALFGWEVIDSFYKKEQLDFINQVISDSLEEVDSRILRFSKTIGVDVTPLIHFWGVQPKDKLALKAKIQAENLKPSKLICDRLTHYKSILPANNAQFVAHAKTFFGGSVPSGGNPDYGSGWYNVWLPLYNTSHGTVGKNALQQIIDTYFPGGCPTDVIAPVVKVDSQSICEGQSVTLTASGATYYLWGNGATDRSITVSPTKTTTYTVTGKTAGYTNLASAIVTVNPIPKIKIDSASICAGDSVTLIPSGATSYEWSNGLMKDTVTLSPLSSTVYALLGRSLGCTSDTALAYVEVKPNPIITLDDQSICIGDSAVLKASGATSYIWSNGAVTDIIFVNPFDTITYSVVGSKDGCLSDSTYAQVIVKPKPEVEVNDAIICKGQVAALIASGAVNYEWSTGQDSAKIEVSPIDTTNYFVIGWTDGCASDTIRSEVIVKPIPLITVDSASICMGDTVVLEASGATNFIWSNGNIGSGILVNPSTTTSYTVIGITEGCNASKTTKVKVNPLPFVSLGNDTTLIMGKTLLIYATGIGLSYLWSTGATTPTLLVKNGGSYSVAVKNEAGCIAIDTIEVRLISNTDEIASIQNITLMPNPTKDLVYVKSNVPMMALQVIDEYGKVVINNSDLSSDRYTSIIDLSQLPPASYFIKIMGSSYINTMQVVKL